MFDSITIDTTQAPNLLRIRFILQLVITHHIHQPISKDKLFDI